MTKQSHASPLFRRLCRHCRRVRWRCQNAIAHRGCARWCSVASARHILCGLKIEPARSASVPRNCNVPATAGTREHEADGAPAVQRSFLPDGASYSRVSEGKQHEREGSMKLTALPLCVALIAGGAAATAQGQERFTSSSAPASSRAIAHRWGASSAPPPAAQGRRALFQGRDERTGPSIFGEGHPIALFCSHEPMRRSLRWPATSNRSDGPASAQATPRWRIGRPGAMACAAAMMALASIP
jgi:hypothetical protein